MRVYVDVFTHPTKPGYMVYGIGRGGAPEMLGSHVPWFIAFTQDRVKLTEALEEMKSKKLVVGWEEELNVVPLVLRNGRYEAGLDYTPYRVLCARKEHVPTVAERLERAGHLVGEHNIVYAVRVSFDLDVKFFTPKCPMIFVPNSELESLSYEMLEKFKDMKVLAFDVEVWTEPGRFPPVGSPILSLQYAVSRLGDHGVAEESWPRDNVVVITASKANEEESAEIVEKFIEVLKKEAPDVIVGYNSAAFDLKYMRVFLPQEKTSLIFPEPFHVNVLFERIFPHVDLLLVRKSMGSSLGLRTLVAQALDDVVRELVRGTRFEWVLASRYMEAESRLDHTRIAREWASGSQLFYDYVTADVYLTTILAHMWLHTLIFMSALVQVPITQLAKLNLGQVAEYNFVHWLERLGFRVSATKRSEEIRKVASLGAFAKHVHDPSLFTKGKVYARSYGVFRNVLECDFAQLYPTLMAVDTVDPLGARISHTIRQGDVHTSRTPDPIFDTPVAKKVFPVVTGRKERKSHEHMVPTSLNIVAFTYGPIAFLIYKMFTLRRITKKIKKQAEQTGRHELVSLDQAVKILNNASYGAFSKKRGFVNPVVSAYVFWKTLNILYDVIGYAEKNLGLTVVYGDTDSLFVLCDQTRASSYTGSTMKEKCWEWFTKEIVPKLNAYVQSKYGKDFELSPEDAFDICVFPKSKHSNEPSKKSYICGNYDESGKLEIEVKKGEFYKVQAPEGIKEQLDEIYARLIESGSAEQDVVRVVEEVLKRVQPHKLFYKKTVDTFLTKSRSPSEQPSAKYKRLNKAHHYATLHVLFTSYEHIEEFKERNLIQVLKDGRVGASRVVTYYIDPESIIRDRGNVVVYFIPQGDPTRFLVFVDYDEKSDTVVVHSVVVKSVTVTDTGYVVSETYTELKLPRDRIVKEAVKSSTKYFVDDVAKKLIPALRRNGGAQ